MFQIDSQVETEVVRLLKLKTPLLAIAEETGTDLPEIEKISKVYRVIELRNTGKAVENISNLVGFSTRIVKKILIQKGAKDLKPVNFKNKKPLTRQELRLCFEELYFRFVKALNVGSPRVLRVFKLDAVRIFFRLLEETPTLKTRVKTLMPVFVYSFLRDRGIDITFTHLKKYSGLTRHQSFQMFKKISEEFPKHTTRERKPKIIEYVTTVKNHFLLSSQFLENAAKILEKFWGLLSDTTDKVIAGTISALALISLRRDSPYMLHLCVVLGIAQSSVIYNIKKLAKNLGILGFTTVGRSKDLIRCQILAKVESIQYI